MSGVLTVNSNVTFILQGQTYCKVDTSWIKSKDWDNYERLKKDKFEFKPHESFLAKLFFSDNADNNMGTQLLLRCITIWNIVMKYW